jgi:hypothetical protein
LQTVGPWSSNVEYFVTFKGGNEWVNGFALLGVETRLKD